MKNSMCTIVDIKVRHRIAENLTGIKFDYNSQN